MICVGRWVNGLRNPGGELTAKGHQFWLNLTSSQSPYFIHNHLLFVAALAGELTDNVFLGNV